MIFKLHLDISLLRLFNPLLDLAKARGDLVRETLRGLFQNLCWLEEKSDSMVTPAEILNR